MKTTISRLLFVCLLLVIAFGLSSQNVNIGNFTSLKVNKGTIYVAGQKGIAAFKADLSVLWEKPLPESTIRLIEVSDNNIALSSYVFEGRQGQLFSSFSSLWDKISLKENTVVLMNLDGGQVWSTSLKGNSKLSAPAIGSGIVAVTSNDSLYTFDMVSGRIKTQTYNNEKFLLGKNIKDHAIPNRPLIAKDAIYTAAPFKFTKIDFSGKLIKAKEMYGLMAPLPIMTVAPIIFDNKIFVSNSPTGQRGQKDGVARLFCVKDDLDKDWDEFVDMKGQSGVCDLIQNGKAVIVATNYDVMAFNTKGKKLWENNKKIGLPILRGIRYGFGATLGVKKSAGNFLCADEKFVYLASGTKIKKVWKDQILVLDATTGKQVKVIDIDNVVVDMSLLNGALVLITEANKVSVLNN